MYYWCSFCFGFGVLLLLFDRMKKWYKKKSFCDNHHPHSNNFKTTKCRTKQQHHPVRRLLLSVMEVMQKKTNHYNGSDITYRVGWTAAISEVWLMWSQTGFVFQKNTDPVIRFWCLWGNTTKQSETHSSMSCIAARRAQKASSKDRLAVNLVKTVWLTNICSSCKDKWKTSFKTTTHFKATW